MSNWSNSETGQILKLVKSQSGQIHSALIRELASYLRITKWSNSETGQIPNWSNLKLVKFWNWSNSETGQKSKWSNPLSAYSGVSELSQNYKVVKFWNWSNLKLVETLPWHDIRWIWKFQDRRTKPARGPGVEIFPTPRESPYHMYLTLRLRCVSHLRKVPKLIVCADLLKLMGLAARIFLKWFFEICLENCGFFESKNSQMEKVE